MKEVIIKTQKKPKKTLEFKGVLRDLFIIFESFKKY